MGHGSEDHIFDLADSIKSAKSLVDDFGWTEEPKEPPAPKPIGLSYHIYEDMGHGTCNDELFDVKNWLKRISPRL